MGINFSDTIEKIFGKNTLYPVKMINDWSWNCIGRYLI